MTPPVTGYYTEAEADATFVARSGSTTIGTLASTNLALANTAKLKFQHLNDTAITGAGNHTLDPSDAVFVKLGSLSAGGNLSGISGGEDGRFLMVYNSSTANTLTIKYDDSSASAANRIYTMSAADTVITARGSATFIYDTEVSRWILLAVNP
jgi:hypothetical protein